MIFLLQYIAVYPSINNHKLDTMQVYHILKLYILLRYRNLNEYHNRLNFYFLKYRKLG